MRITQSGDKPKSVFGALRDIARAAQGESVSIESFSKGLGRRSYGLLLLTLNLPNLVPLPLPLLSLVFGFPLALVGLQLALGLERPWIPGFLRRRGIGKKEMHFFCDHVEKRYGWFHGLIRPRFPVMTRGIAVRLIGLTVFVLASVMAMPIPFGNLVLAIPIATLALGLIERDGAFVLGGLVLGVCGLVFNLMVGSSILYGMLRALEHFFG